MTKGFHTKFIRKLKKLKFSKFFNSKRRTNIGITLFVVFLLIFLGTLLIEREDTGLKIELKDVPDVKVVVPKKQEKEELFDKRPKVAVILDDAGGEMPDYSAVFSIGQPVTMSIIPYLLRSREIAKKASYSGMEVMLHLPMEPENSEYTRNDGSMILSSMPDDEIKSFVVNSLENVKWAVGINNHMGSRATKSVRVMKWSGFIKLSMRLWNS